MKRTDIILLVVAVCLGAGFFISLSFLWPLAEFDLYPDSGDLSAQARKFLETRGINLSGYRSNTYLWVDEQSVDSLATYLGQRRTQQLIAGGCPVIGHRVLFKKGGSAIHYRVVVHPGQGITGFTTRLRKDDPGETISEEKALEMAVEELDGILGPLAKEFVAIGKDSLWIERSNYTFTFQRTIHDAPRISEQVLVTVSGSRVTGLERKLDLASSIKETRRTETAYREALLAAGIICAVVAIVWAFILFLRFLQNGQVEIRKTLGCVGVIFLLACLANVLQSAYMFRQWDPLWPGWIFKLQYMVYNSAGELIPLLLILVFIAAGDVLDRESGNNRGQSLWLLLRGKLGSIDVALSSLRGFLVGLVCGGVLTGSVILMQTIGGSRIGLQPVGFFFYAINSASPSLSTLAFFLKIAMIEELGYRFFGGAWLMSITSKKWIAVLAPAMVYGLLHTRMNFLPPATPFWGRALVLTLVGCVWGWAFLKYDALTVILSHFTADLFIFNWPRIASGKPPLVTAAALTIMVPLVPVVYAACLRMLHALLGKDPKTL